LLSPCLDQPTVLFDVSQWCMPLGKHLTFDESAFPFVYQTNLTSVSVLVPLITDTVVKPQLD